MDAIHTERLLLRPWAPEDVRLLADLSSIPRMTRHVGDGHTWTPLKAMTVSDRALDHWREHGFGWCVIVDLASGEDIGLISHNRMGDGTAGLDPEEHEIGWWVAPTHWGHGYAREAAGAILRHSFEALRVPHMTARIAPENAASVAVALAIGMTFEFNTVATPGVLVAIYRALNPEHEHASAEASP